MPTFSPPQSGVESMLRYTTSGHRLFSFYVTAVFASVLFRNGHFVQVYEPYVGETEALEEGVTYFQGGRTYLIDENTAHELIHDGFEVNDFDGEIPDVGFGSGVFGEGAFGS